jgi:hypothetical protein
MSLQRFSPITIILFLLIAVTPSASGYDSMPFEAGYPDQAVTLFKADEISIEAGFELPEFQTEQLSIQGDQFDKFTIEGESVAGPAGWPELPNVTRYYLVPPRSGIGLEISKIESRTESGVFPYPRQLLISESDAVNFIGPGEDGNNVDQAISEECLEYDGFWPPQVAELGKPVIMRGYRIVPVIIHPMRWNPRTSEMEIVESLEFKLDFTSDQNKINLVENPNRPRPSQSVDRIVRGLVENSPLPRRDDVRGGSLIYVTPDRNDVVEAIAPLVEWRRRMGWTVEIARVQNNNTTAAVKAVIQEAYDEWDIPPEHIILVGDANGGNYGLGFYDERRDYASYPYETDHHFGCLEGDDIIPEASVGRFCYNTIDMLRGYVNKTIQYESEPYIGEGDDAGWQKRGMVCAIAQTSGMSSIDMCRWSKHLFRTNGYTDVAELYYTNLNPSEVEWIPDELEIGASFFIFRGHLHMGRYAASGNFPVILNLTNGSMLPFVMIVTCNTGDYAETTSGPFYHSEYFAMNPQGGAIGACGASGASHTTYNNILTCATVLAPFIGIPSQGWALVNGKIDLYRNYANRGDINHHATGAENWLTHTHLYNLIGDPAVDLYTDIPQQLEVEHANSIRVGDTRFDVDVDLVRDDPVPAEGVLVCLYKPDEFQLTAYTDANGHATFALNPDWTVAEDEIQLTVTGHNLMPYLADFQVVEAESFIGAGSFEIDDGDDDIANPGETFEISLEIFNYGSEVPDDGLSVVLTPALPNLTVSENADSVHFNDAPEAGQSVTANFVVEVEGGFPQEADALFNLIVTTSDDVFNSIVSIPVEGPQFDLVSFSWDNEPVATGGSADFTVSVVNIGERNSSPLDVSVVCLTQSAEVGANVRRIANGVRMNEVGEPDGNFSVSARVYHLGNQRIDLALILDGENGFQDSVFFSVYSADSDSCQPFGPDKYGYLCVDNTDTNWFDFPVYEWIEIDPSEDGHGTDTEISDTGREQDESAVVELPFDFNYYGVTYNEVTICSNGWMAFGNYRDLATAVNRRIPGGLVAPAMLCPFWDDLITRDESGVYYWYDEENERFIVEWSKMRRLQANNQAGDTETFQVILHDPDNYPSFTGDAHIHFQYLDVTDGRSCDQLFDTPYATVGIGSPKMDDGLEYVYWNDYNPGAAALDSGRCIRFTTLMTFDTGFAEGYVTDARTQLPLANVDIVAFPGYSTITNEAGYYFIDEMIADSLHLYKFTASKWGWNDSTLTGIEIVPNETTRVDFGLLHPEFTLQNKHIWFGLNPDSNCERLVDLTNGGNGTMWFTSRFNYIINENNGLRDDPDEKWEEFLLWNATESTGDTKLTGINFINGQWWVGGNDGGSPPNNYFYRFDRYGEFIDSLTLSQPIVGRNGFNEFDYYDGYIYGVSTDIDHYILKVDAETGEFVDSIFIANARALDIRAITINPTNGHIWAGSSANDLYEFEIVNDTLVDVNSFSRPLDPRDGEYIRRYGLAWYKDDPDEYNLYILSDKDIDGSPEVPDVSIFKMNVETGDVRYETNLPHLDGNNQGRGGMCITPKWNNMVWVVGVVLLNPDGDQVGVYELGPNASWITYEPRSDTLFAGEDIDITLLLDVADLDTGRYGVNIEFYHNAIVAVDTIFITLDVSYSDVPTDGSHQPLEFILDQNYPNPFNSTTSLSYAIEELSNVKLSIYDISGRLVSTLVDDKQKAGYYRVTFNAAEMPNGLYFYRLETQNKIATRKMILMK